MELTDKPARDHGGGIDAAVNRFGGTRDSWLDLSTGINPRPYPLPEFTADDWIALPDQKAQNRIEMAARKFWNVPDDAAILATPGASALIARLPALAPKGKVAITRPTYNEHAAAFASQGWTICDAPPADARILVHPNNPDGRIWDAGKIETGLTIIDESFCDTVPEASFVSETSRPNVVVLKSFGKFWGLAGLRLGFAIGPEALIGRLRDLTGPWAVSGPALRTGAQALEDYEWAQATRARLKEDAFRLDRLLLSQGASLAGGTDLFRLFTVNDAAEWQNRLATKHIWTRTFPYSTQFIRLGLPPEEGWDRLEAAL
ncbi:threonine-phosphate decarboxylase [Primorskyibacter sp. S87]|uniref:threonine-phosphate decarboxylase n=1 Tax=Primorskyibacter sp. S87 TaxID=3415126 RepID=UPI003C7E7F07